MFLLQPFVCRKTSAVNDVWSADIVESGITQRVSKIGVNIASELVQLEVTSVVAKGCVETGTTSSLSFSAIVTHIIEWYSKFIKNNTFYVVYLVEGGLCVPPDIYFHLVSFYWKIVYYKYDTSRHYKIYIKSAKPSS